MLQGKLTWLRTKSTKHVFCFESFDNVIPLQCDTNHTIIVAKKKVYFKLSSDRCKDEQKSKYSIMKLNVSKVTCTSSTFQCLGHGTQLAINKHAKSSISGWTCSFKHGGEVVIQDKFIYGRIGKDPEGKLKASIRLHRDRANLFVSLILIIIL